MGLVCAAEMMNLIQDCIPGLKIIIIGLEIIIFDQLEQYLFSWRDNLIDQLWFLKRVFVILVH